MMYFILDLAGMGRFEVLVGEQLTVSHIASGTYGIVILHLAYNQYACVLYLHHDLHTRESVHTIVLQGVLFCHCLQNRNMSFPRGGELCIR